MKELFKDNRLVKDQTFATRFLRFVESVEIGCAAGEDERDSMISYATDLLKYQVRTAEDEKEIEYLKRVGVWDKYQEPFLETEDGFIIYYESEDCDLFSCMKEPNNGDQILNLSAEKLRNGRAGIKTSRAYFKYKASCIKYLDYNRPRFSKADMDDMLKKYGVL